MNHEFYMREAIKEAKIAYSKGEVPIGAIVVRKGEIIGRGHNLRESMHYSLAHAEIMAIEDASKKLNGWRLTESVIYVTIEPCLMCAGAIYQSRIDTIVYGAKDKKAGACDSLFEIPRDLRLNHRSEVISGILEEECAELMRSFFKELRNK